MAKKAKKSQRKKFNFSQITRTSLGIDVSKKTLHCTLIAQDVKNNHKVLFRQEFSNTLTGFNQLLERIYKKLGKGNKPDLVVMEATGVYYENIAYFLYDKGFNLVVELPKRIRRFAEIISIKTKTDKIDSEVIARYGLILDKNNLTLWRPVSKRYAELKNLIRYRAKIKQQLIRLKNRLEALRKSYQPSKIVIKAILIEMLLQYKLLQKIEKIIKKLVEKDENLRNKIAKVQTIKSVGFWTAITVVIEYNGFILARNRNQVVSYAGLDVVENQSGEHKGKSKISKQGNKIVRSALYMAALSGFRYNPVLKEFYERLIANGKNKAQARAAVARKILIYIYVIWKTDKPFDINYHKKQKQQRKYNSSAA